MADRLLPPKPIADLVIREVPGNMLYFVAINQEVAGRLQTGFEDGEFGTFMLRDDLLTGYLHYPWPFDLKMLAQYMAEVARCKYTLQFRIENLPQLEYRKITGGNHNE